MNLCRYIYYSEFWVLCNCISLLPLAYRLERKQKLERLIERRNKRRAINKKKKAYLASIAK
jgi:hypothetical protein